MFVCVFAFVQQSFAELLFPEESSENNACDELVVVPRCYCGVNERKKYGKGDHGGTTGDWMLRRSYWMSHVTRKFQSIFQLSTVRTYGIHIMPYRRWVDK